MNPVKLSRELSSNTYPGRGIVLGKSQDGRHAAIAYFIMGRSENSRNRIFSENDRGGIKTEAFDPAKLVDPSLIIYNPVLVLGDATIVTNGDQTDTIREGLAAGKTFAQALHTRTFEPDAPNYTPRISGLVKKNGDYTLSILKSADGDPASCRRYFFAYEAPRAGQGHFIHTYMGDGTPLPSFVGEPEQVEIPCGTPAELADLLWDSLNAENKVSLFVRYIDRKTGDWETVIKNKHASA